MKNAIISAEKLNLIFETADDDVVALKDVSLNIDKGEFVSFIGPSGCGKTTFLRAIASLEKPSSGNLSVNGLSPEEARKKRAYGYVFQAAGLYPWRNIYRNVSLPLEIMGYKKNEIPGIVDKVLKLVDLTGFEKKFPWQLSGGMQQRASIARALSFDADILLMDEPFAALDEMTRFKLNNDVLSFWENTKLTVIFVTHSVFESVYLSNRVVVMAPRPGRVVADISLDENYPRTDEYRTTSEYAEKCRLVSGHLQSTLIEN